MNKLVSLRKAINDTNVELAKDPDRLLVFATKGKAVATGANSLSFEYQYDAKVIVVDCPYHPDRLVIPLLAWIRKNQPELVMNSANRENGLSFNIDITANDLYDIEITIPVTERVKVWVEEGGLACEHLPEPDEDPYDGVEWSLYINGEEQPWPPALVSEVEAT